MNHPASKSLYFYIWLALMLLLFATWGAAKFDLGIANPVVALVIAFIKMLLVILFFMQVRYHSKMTRLFAGAGFVWFLIMITFTMTDYLSRHTVRPYDRAPNPTIETNAAVRVPMQTTGSKSE